MTDDATTSAVEQSAASERDDVPLDTVEGLLRAGLSTLAVVAHGLLFGLAFGAGMGLVARQGDGLPLQMDGVTVLGSFVVVPVATFLFVVLYYDADPELPEWGDGHPPLVDVWAWALVTFVGVFAVVPTSAWPGESGLVALAVVAVTAYLVVPCWLARRWLADGNWALGGLTVLGSILVLAGSLPVLAALSTLDALPNYLLAALLIGTTTLTYVPAYYSPGPERLAARVAGWLA